MKINFYNKILIKVILTGFLCTGNLIITYGEGTKSIQFNASDDHSKLQIWDSDRKFATYKSEPNRKLNIEICNTSEKIHFGAKIWDSEGKDVYFRLKDPDGNIVLGPEKIPASGQGHIDTYQDAVDGPAPLNASGGYDPITYNPTKTGSYYIEFNPGDPNKINNGPRVIFDLFDITVESGTSPGNPIEGRLWSRKWDFSTTAFTNPFDATLYVYSNDSVVTSVDFNGMQAYGFAVSTNSTGLTNTGNPIEDRRSKAENKHYPEYKIFLNEPDPNCFPPAKALGQLSNEPSITGCHRDDQQINYEVNKGGDVEIILDLNSKKGFQPGTEDRKIRTKAKTGKNSLSWDGKNGKGEYVDAGTDIKLEVIFYNGLTHLPLYDVENQRNGFIVELVSPSKGSEPELYWNDEYIQSRPGNNLDGIKNLQGCDDNNGCHKWENRDEETINTWWYIDSSAKKVSPEFNIIGADAETRIADSLTVDTTVCSTINSYNLSGAVSGDVDGNQWTSITGSNANFSDRSDLNGTYTFTQSEINNKEAKIELSAVKNSCRNARDTLVVDLQPPPDVDAGDDKPVCPNTSPVSLNGSYSNANHFYWHGEMSGDFNPDSLTMNASYELSQEEIDSLKPVTLKLTANNDICKPVTDSMQISFIDAPVPDAGEDDSVCSTNSDVQLAGDIAGSYSDNEWRALTGNNTNFSDRNDLTATYTFTANEKDSGFAKFELNALKNNNNCKASDTVRIDIKAAPEVDAGNDTAVCYQNPVVSLDGSYSNASGIYWNGGKGNYSPDTLSVDSDYILSDEEIEQADPINLEISTINDGVCSSVSDQIKITFKNIPSTDAGEDTAICKQAPEIRLNGSIEGSGQGHWVGNGTFSPDANDMKAVYNPTNNEIDSGNAELILVGDSNPAGCKPLNDTLQIFYTDPFVLDAGPDQRVCKNINSIDLNGRFANENINQNPPAVTWTNVNGVFEPSAHSLKTSYSPSSFEREKDSVDLVLEQDASNICAAENDTLSIYFQEPDDMNLSHDHLIVCQQEGPGELVDVQNTFSNYQWYKDNEIISEATSNRYEIKEAGIYHVTARDQWDCLISDTIEVKEKYCEPEIHVPDIFTPNNDGINDHLELFGKNIDQLEFKIFNRWGEIIYVAYSLDDKWDGIYRDKKVQIGSYTWKLDYVIETRDGDEVEKVRYGEVIVAE